MIEPDIILPSQFLQRVLATPEKRLLLAVLEEAVGTYQRYAIMTDGRSRAVFAEVEAWFERYEPLAVRKRGSKLSPDFLAELNDRLDLRERLLYTPDAPWRPRLAEALPLGA